MRAKELSAFCVQISFLLSAGISIDGGLSVIAEDATTVKEKEMLLKMSGEVGAGYTLALAMENSGEFPPYVVKMANVGQETGTLEVTMKALADYYEKEHSLAQTLKNAVTYPVVMVFMLVTVLFVILTKVMPIFEDVYIQLGAELPAVTVNAIKVGSVASGIILLGIIFGGITVLITFVLSKKFSNIQFAERIIALIKERSLIADSMAKRRFASILATTIKSGLDTDKAIDMAADLIFQKKINAKIIKVKETLENGVTLYEALRIGNIFSGLDMQMIKVGSRSGKLDTVFKELSIKYEMEVDNAIDKMIGRFEPTMVGILAIVVGLILLAVMMPLVGIMAAIG
jgi:type IV pilus assembly protein PilC